MTVSTTAETAVPSSNTTKLDDEKGLLQGKNTEDTPESSYADETPLVVPQGRDNEEEENIDDETSGDGYDENYVELTEDIYSFLLTSRPTSRPFFFAVVVFLFQSSLFCLILVDIIELGTDNPMQIPPGVNDEVSASQFLLLPLAVAVEADMIASLIMFHDGYNVDVLKSAPAATYGNWLLSCTLKFAGGALALFTNFTLMVQSTSVVDMFLNFAALGMVSQSSPIAFTLAKLGFLSNPLQEATHEVCNIKVPTKSGSNVLRRVAFFAIWLGLVCGWSVFFHWQRTGKYLCSTLAIQFGDEFSPDLGGFSGTYLRLDTRKISGRVVYVEENSGRAMFAYCKDLNAWTFSYGSNSLDPCQFEAVSPETETYDITDTNPSDWFVGNVDKGPVPFQFASLICFDCEESDEMTCTNSGRQCKRATYGLQCQFSEPCGNLAASPPGSRFRYSRNSRIYKGFWQSGEFFSPIVSAPPYIEDGNTYQSYLKVNDRPVFAYEYSSQIDYTQLGLPDQSGFFEIILFTGRRWIFTTSEVLSGLKTTDGRTDVKRLTEYFASFHSYFSDYGALYISDPTDYGTPTESGTPERLSWYRVAPGTKNDAETSLQSDVVLLCSCDDEYPCFEGVCVNRIGDFNRTYSACLCVQGFGGSLCQKQCNEGFDGYDCGELICGEKVPCNNGGSCSAATGILDTTARQCDCPQGYGGKFCDYLCPTGYMGFDCEDQFCTAEEPCRNGGVCRTGTSNSILPYTYNFCECIQGFGDHLCQEACDDGYSGINCDVPVCNEDVPCMNGGFCDLRTGVSNTTFKFCACDQSFGGPLCDHVCPPGYGGYDCSDTYCGAEFPCAHDGTCETAIAPSGTAFTKCSCREGYGGAFCEDLCQPGYTGLFCDEVACSNELPCSNSGICKVRTGTTGGSIRYCSCPFGFGGSLCEEQCPPGFSGSFCNERNCGSVFPCQNGGSCELVTDGSIASSTFCNCSTGFGGEFCEFSCPYGFSGPFCDEQLACSVEVPCLNDGVCVPPTIANNEKKCVCRQGYGGPLCDLLCPPGFTGTSCNEIAQCRETGRRRCRNGGVCVEDAITQLSKCQCPLGYGGFLCDIACPYGYSDYYCDKRACSSAFPCLNNGTCVTEIEGSNCLCLTGFGGFFCEDQCRYGYSGMDCENRMQCSSSLPCLNNGTCGLVKSDASGNSTFCDCRFGVGGAFCEIKCPFGYTGTYCEQVASCSDQLGCLNEGTCTVREVGNSSETTCECPPGFGGSLCQIRCPQGYTGAFCDVPAE